MFLLIDSLLCNDKDSPVDIFSLFSTTDLRSKYIVTAHSSVCMYGRNIIVFPAQNEVLSEPLLSPIVLLWGNHHYYLQ